MKKLLSFVKKETVLCIALLCALVSMIFVPPSAAYLSYIDWRVLGLLWCLMSVTAMLRSRGVFDAMTRALLSSGAGPRLLGVLLVLLPFFVSMFVTNDVALLAFVPFTLALLSALGCIGRAPYLLVLQTAAANLGSMALPVGNPQNLYLYACYNMTPGEFFSAVLPYAGVSLVLLCLAALPALPRTLPAPQLPAKKSLPKAYLALTGALFLLCLLSVFRVLAWYITLLIVLAALLIADRPRLKDADYGLLLTFVCFFIFSGNLGAMPAVHSLLQKTLAQNTLLTAALTSQVISNVPAAVLLSGFTENGRALLLGTDLGGLGTPVASLASLITLKLYFRSEGASRGKYLAIFLLINFALLALLLLLTAVFG